VIYIFACLLLDSFQQYL